MQTKLIGTTLCTPLLNILYTYTALYWIMSKKSRQPAGSGIHDRLASREVILWHWSIGYTLVSEKFIWKQYWDIFKYFDNFIISHNTKWKSLKAMRSLALDLLQTLLIKGEVPYRFCCKFNILSFLNFPYSPSHNWLFECTKSVVTNFDFKIDLIRVGPFSLKKMNLKWIVYLTCCWYT